MERPTPRSAGSVSGGPSGFTLVELVVVLFLLALATAIVGPAFLPRDGGASAGIAAVAAEARRIAVRRGETVYLSVAPGGEWVVESEDALGDGPITGGRLDVDAGRAGFTLVFSPLGSCGFDLRSIDAARTLEVDGLSCEVRSP